MKIFYTRYNDNYIRLTVFRDNSQKPRQFFLPNAANEKIVNTESDHDFYSNIRRTKSTLKKIVLANDWDYFCTWTVNSKCGDRYSLEFCQSKMKALIKAYKRKFHNFKFVYITEKHKDGAFHFHGLVKSMGDLYINDNGYYSSTTFDKLGFNSFSKIKNKNKCGNYIMKYITKDCLKNDKGSIYFCSRGLSHRRNLSS